MGTPELEESAASRVTGLDATNTSSGIESVGMSLRYSEVLVPENVVGIC
jgi:hypothetical protein